jgi:nucleoside-diphosphate-sugar epimerase
MRKTGVVYLKVLITGATGQLGLALLKQLKNTDYQVKITSRRKPQNINQFEWVYSDFSTGEGLKDAITDIDVIIHAATSPMKNSKNVDVLGF